MKKKLQSNIKLYQSKLNFLKSKEKSYNNEEKIRMVTEFINILQELHDNILLVN